MKAITPHYIDGKVVEPHGREVMDSINPTNNTVIGRVTLADEEDAKRAIACAKHATDGAWLFAERLLYVDGWKNAAYHDYA
jgi:acyl-CoA reductase-like NAD-dependent aldehyde dehydrogenase